MKIAKKLRNMEQNAAPTKHSLVEAEGIRDCLSRLEEVQQLVQPKENEAMQTDETIDAWFIYPKEEWRPCHLGKLPGGVDSFLGDSLVIESMVHQGAACFDYSKS